MRPLKLPLPLLVLLLLAGCPSGGGETGGGADSQAEPGTSQTEQANETTQTGAIEGGEDTGGKEETMSELSISSSAFDHEDEIPPKYTDDGADINPPLEFSGIPDGAESLVLIVDDPDAPGTVWDHWVLYNIPPGTTEIAEDSSPEGAVTGKNDWGDTSYGGPAPPSGVHRYFFKLYALDTELDLSSGATKEQVESAMEGHILDRAELMGKYSR